jgi:hypothetical protein
MTRLITSILFLATMALLGGCGGSDSGTGTLSVQVTDAKVDNATAVVLHYTHVTIHGEGGNTLVDVFDPDTGNPGRSINLLDYTNGESTELFEKELSAGHYSWMRLDIDFDKSYIQLDDGSMEPLDLYCTSCENNGMKLNRSFTIEADQTTAFTLDFDLRSSITYADGKHYIRPTIRVVGTSGAIAGEVSETLLTDLGSDGSGCAVYVFDGADAQLDDIYIPMSGPVPAEQNNPVTTAMVTYNAEAETPTYSYMAAFLPEGTYTVSLTCDAALDDSATDEPVTETPTGEDPANMMLFTGTENNVPVTAGAVTPVNFDVVEGGA